MYLRYLLEFVQDNFQAIHSAATKGQLNIVQLLVDVYEIDPTAKDKVHTYVHVCMYVCTYLCMVQVIRAEQYYQFERYM